MSRKDGGEEIAKRGHEFTTKIFTPESIDCYNYFLVLAQSKKFKKVEFSTKDLSVRHIEDVMVKGYDYVEAKKTYVGISDTGERVKVEL